MSWIVEEKDDSIILRDGKKVAIFDLTSFNVPIWDLDFQDPEKLLTGLYHIWTEELTSAPALLMIDATDQPDWANEVAYDIEKVLDRITAMFSDRQNFEDAIEAIYARYDNVYLDAAVEYGDAKLLGTDLTGGVFDVSVDFSRISQYDVPEFLAFIDQLSFIYSKISNKREEVNL